MSGDEVALLVAGTAGVLFALYNLFHYVLFLLVTHPRPACRIGHTLNEFEQRQLVEWKLGPDDFLKHDDEKRTYDDVFRISQGRREIYSSCVFPRTLFGHPYVADFWLLSPHAGMRLLELGCGSGTAANYFASRCNVEIVCVTNSIVQAELCERKFTKFNGRLRVMVADFDTLTLPEQSFDAIYAFESIGYSKDLDAWLERCQRMLKPGGKLLIRSPASLENCLLEQDYRNVTAFFDNWRYNFIGANLLVNRLRRAGFGSIRYRQLPFWAWGATWNFIQHVLLWKFRLKMRTIVNMERIIWRTSKAFVFGNAYNTVLAVKASLPVVPAPERDAISEVAVQARPEIHAHLTQERRGYFESPPCSSERIR